VEAVSEPREGYVSIGLLARGGMGEVRLGLRQAGAFRRLVAIKRLRTEHRSDESFRRMFVDEGRLAGLVRHPNVVSVLDVGEDEEGPFLVMDFVEGVTAHQVLKRLSAEGERLPLQVAARVAHQVALGLTAVHELCTTEGEALGLIHRDVSPQNVLLGFDGVARVADFGIAKTQGSDATTTGVLKGKIGYMSPEQLRFERPTQQSDLFSFGVLLFELLAGRRLYHGPDLRESAQQILSAPAPDLGGDREDAPPQLVELVFELLAKDPSHRPASAREVVARLGDVLEELVGLEGRLELGEYLATHFEDEAVTLRERSASLVRAWEESRTEAPPPAQPPTTRRWVAAGILAGAALASVGVYFAWPTHSAPALAASDAPPATSTAIESAASEADHRDAATGQPDPPPTDTSGEHASATDPRADVAPTAEAEESQPAPTTRRTRARARRRARPAEEAASPRERFRAIDLIRGER